MGTVVSKDGTAIAFSRMGQGLPVILVDGALCYRGFGPTAPLAELLKQHFTVFTYDRRGRGESDDTHPYAVEREIEDIEALIETAGGSASVYGVSSGAVLALKAASQMGKEKVTKLALCQPPFNTGEEARQDFLRYTRQMDELLNADKRSEAVAFFLADMLPPEMLAKMQQSPEWTLLEAIAHTIAYDNAVMGDGEVPLSAARTATMPTLVLDGDRNPDFLHSATDALTAAMSHARRKTLPMQADTLLPEDLAPALVEFFLNEDLSKRDNHYD